LKGFEVLESQKKVAWLNTVRVFAAFTIILSHFFGGILQGHHAGLYNAFCGTGHVGVILFFAVSGYLAGNSISHSATVFEFYRRKFIRILVPFVSAYIILGTLFILLGTVEFSLATKSPFWNVFSKDGTLWGIFFGILPVEENLIKCFDLPRYAFVGEWFIGTIVFLYLLSPLLDKILRYNFFLVLILSLIIS